HCCRRLVTAAIVHPKRSTPPIDTSMVIEASTSAWSRLALLTVARLGRVDTEDLPEPAPSQRRDDDGLALLHPLRPAQIEAAPGDGRPHRAGDVRATLGPIEAEPAVVAAGRTPSGELDPELGEKPDACCRDLGDVVVEHDVLAGDQGIGQVHAETTGKMVVAD